MEEEIKALIGVAQGMQSQLAYLIAENAAMAAIIRALVEANTGNPTFQAALNTLVEARNIRQLNSTMSDEGIAAFKKALNSLLPQPLRDI
ncbi:hypothetical protein VSR34_01145 [Paraburkholderia sp. JHI2823]|uniref:hypothetical protein n=1 Tax=Paraburkholderia sp. JHI2823 TaxID=3112960 RepID=UPI00316D7311